jgi:DNA-binding transcriptional MerR regulator
MEFLASDVEKICGVKRNRLQVWMEREWIVPSGEKADGHGTRNKFSEADLYEILMFKELVESGLSRAAVAELKIPVSDLVKGYLKTIKKLEKHNNLLTSNNPIDYFFFFFRKRNKVVKVSASIPTPSFLGADNVIGINFANIIRKVQRKIKEIKG